MNQELFNNQFKYSPFIPYDPTVNPLYTGYTTHPTIGGVQPFVYSDWREEELSWHDNCYIHAGLNPFPISSIKGPDALKFLDENLANGFRNFPIGKIKHAVMVNEDGLLMADGLLLRIGEEEYEASCLTPYIDYRAEIGDYDVKIEDKTGDTFLFQLGGPFSLEIVEAATNEDFHNLKFLEHRMSSINGMEVRVLRVGMAGSLAYEVHGVFRDSIPVYESILEAGKPYNITRLGRHAYWNAHTENGFPQAIIHFPYAVETDRGYWDYLVKLNNHALYFSASFQLRTGSMGPDPEARFVNPIELGWGAAVSFQHDFIGKQALLRIKDRPHRQMVTLVWEPEDILDVYRSEFEKDEPYAPMEGPEDFLSNGKFEYRADKVLIGDQCVGSSTGRIHSWFYREMLSLALVEPEYCALGTKVDVLWGDPGTRQKRIRARVSRFPYMDIGRNEVINVGAIPSGLRR